jgi:hypothetical protein
MLWPGGKGREAIDLLMLCAPETHSSSGVQVRVDTSAQLVQVLVPYAWVPRCRGRRLSVVKGQVRLRLQLKHRRAGLTLRQPVQVCCHTVNVTADLSGSKRVEVKVLTTSSWRVF